MPTMYDLRRGRISTSVLQPNCAVSFVKAENKIGSAMQRRANDHHPAVHLRLKNKLTKQPRVAHELYAI